jgi:hypothetical protein
VSRLGYGLSAKEVKPKAIAAVLLAGTSSPMTQAIVCGTLIVEARSPMSTKGTSPILKTSLDGPDGRRYRIPRDKEQAFAAWAAAVDNNQLDAYIQNGGETFERYRFADYAYNFALLKSFYAQAAN